MTSDGQKSTTAETEHQDSDERKRAVEAKIRQRVALEEKAFRTVESFLDNPVTADQLVEAASLLDQSHYEDIVEERSIALHCGYPLCDDILTKVPKQKYHICTRSNKIFDITERKKFCSNLCFKASSYYHGQLLSSPVWLRDEDNKEKVSVTLLPHKTSMHPTKGLLRR